MPTSAPFTLDLVHELLRELLAAGTGLSVDSVTLVSSISATAERASLFVGQGPALSLCLVDLRENQKLRSKTSDDPPRPGYYRLDCHYLLFAKPGSGKSLGYLLYAATLALNDAIPLRPARILDAKQTLWAKWPEDHKDHEFPLRVNPAEGFTRTPEIWTALNSSDRFVAPVYFIVTVPVLPQRTLSFPPVTALGSTFAAEASGERSLIVGGYVYDAAKRPLPATTVILADAAGDTLVTTSSDSSGAYVIALSPGQLCQLFAARPGYGISNSISIDLTLLGGALPPKYDLTFK